MESVSPAIAPGLAHPKSVKHFFQAWYARSLASAARARPYWRDCAGSRQRRRRSRPVGLYHERRFRFFTDLSRSEKACTGEDGDFWDAPLACLAVPLPERPYRRYRPLMARSLASAARARPYRRYHWFQRPQAPTARARRSAGACGGARTDTRTSPQHHSAQTLYNLDWKSRPKLACADEKLFTLPVSNTFYTSERRKASGKQKTR